MTQQQQRGVLIVTTCRMGVVYNISMFQPCIATVKMRRKSVHNGTDIRMAKREKVEGKEAADCRNLGYKVEEVAGALKKRLEKLCGLLEDNPIRLRNRDVEDLIRCVKVEDIIRLASRSNRRNAMSNFGYLEAGPFEPSYEKVARLLRLMLLCGIEKLKAVDLYILYNNFPKAGFAFMLLHALDSYNKRCRPGDGECVYLKEEERRATICKLCHIMPWKLFAHVMYDMTSLPVFKFPIAATTSEEKERGEEEGSDDEDLQKKAAERCKTCYGKGKHSGVYGYYCSFWDSVPIGLPVGPNHMIYCRDCRVLNLDDTFVQCRSCGCEIGQALPSFPVAWRRL